MAKKEKKHMKTTTKRFLLRTLGGIVAVAPVAVLTYVNRENYFQPGNEVKLSIGAFMAMAGACLSLSGKTEFLKGDKLKIFIGILLYLLQSLITDIIAIYWVVYGGDLAYRMIFKKKIDDYTETINIENEELKKLKAQNKAQKIIEAENKKLGSV